MILVLFEVMKMLQYNGPRIRGPDKDSKYPLNGEPPGVDRMVVAHVWVQTD